MEKGHFTSRPLTKEEVAEGTVTFAFGPVQGPTVAMRVVTEADAALLDCLKSADCQYALTWAAGQADAALARMPDVTQYERHAAALHSLLIDAEG